MIRRLAFAAALLSPLFAFADSAPAAPQTFHYEVSFAGDPEVHRVALKTGETKSVKLPRDDYPYDRETTSISRHLFDALARAGKLPAHDVAKCKKDRCLLIVKGALWDGRTVQLSRDGEEGLKTGVVFTDELVRVDTANRPGFIVQLPITEITQSYDVVSLKAGDSYLAETRYGHQATVKLVAVE